MSETPADGAQRGDPLARLERPPAAQVPDFRQMTPQRRQAFRDSIQAAVKHVSGRIDNSSCPAATPSIEITLFLPPETDRAVPMVTTVGGFFFGPNNPNQLPDRIAQVPAFAWGYGTVNTGAIQADNGAGLNAEIIGLVNRGEPRDAEDWGVLAAWSWGLSRALDCLESDPRIGATRAAIQGHSRWGKTALLAGALDQRWAIVFASCSGAMGASGPPRCRSRTCR